MEGDFNIRQFRHQTKWSNIKVRTDTTILVRRTRYRAKLDGSFGSSQYTFPYVLTLRLGPILQFRFAEPDTEPNWVVCLDRHDTFCRYVLTLSNMPKLCAHCRPLNLTARFQSLLVTQDERRHQSALRGDGQLRGVAVRRGQVCVSVLV